MNNPKELETALDALRDYFQTAHRDLEGLRDDSGAHERRVGDMATALETIQQELRTVQQAATLLETSLHAQTTAAHEQNETQAHELAALNSRQQAFAQELASTQEQRLAEVAKILESLHAGQEKMADFDHRLAAQAEQFGKFESVIRELHGELLAIYQRLTVLETTANPDLLAAHAQRLDQAEQQVLEQRQTLNELRQALERLESRESAPAKTNTALLGIGLAVLLTAVLVLISLNTHIF